MGGAWDAISSGLKPSIDPKQTIDGTGQTAGDLKSIGYSDDDLSSMGAKKSPGQTQLAIGDAFKTGLTNYGNARDAGKRQSVSPAFFGIPTY